LWFPSVLGGLGAGHGFRQRRKAARQGLTLSKSRRRDPDATDFGAWSLVRVNGRVVLKGTLQDVERFLTRR